MAFESCALSPAREGQQSFVLTCGPRQQLGRQPVVMHKASRLEVSLMDSLCLHIPSERVAMIGSDSANSAYETWLYLFADIVAVLVS